MVSRAWQVHGAGQSLVASVVAQRRNRAAQVGIVQAGCGESGSEVRECLAACTPSQEPVGTIDKMVSDLGQGTVTFSGLSFLVCETLVKTEGSEVCQTWVWLTLTEYSEDRTVRVAEVGKGAGVTSEGGRT